jgi:hypothetical protein
MRARLSVFPCEAAITSSRYLQGKAETHVWLPGAAFMQRTEVWCASAGSPRGAARRAGVRKAPLEAAFAPPPSAGATICPAKTICMSRFVHVQTNGADPLLEYVPDAPQAISALSPRTTGSVNQDPMPIE